MRYWLFALMALLALPAASNAQMSLYLAMPSTHVKPGDPFSLTASIANKGPGQSGVLFVVFQGLGVTLFLPSWSEGVDSQAITVPTGGRQIPLITPFLFPDAGNDANGLSFTAAVLSPDLKTFLTEPVTITWSWEGYGPGYTIEPDALLKVGPVPGEPGAYIMPNGRKIKPVGDLYVVPPSPINMLLTPNGRYVVTAHSSNDPYSLSVFDTASRQVTQVIEDGSYYLGLTMSSDGNTVYVCNGGAKIRVWDLRSGQLNPRVDWAIEQTSAGIALSADENYLFVLIQIAAKLQILDTRTGGVVGETMLAQRPHSIALHPDGRRAFVTCEQDNLVQIVDVSIPAAPRVLKAIEVPKNPEDIAYYARNDMFYVACADEDVLVSIDARINAAVRAHDLRPHHTKTFGTQPHAIYIDEARGRAYIAQASDNKLAVMDLATEEIFGHIPTGWFPSDMAVSPDGGTLYVTNFKGTSSGQARIRIPGKLQVAPMPSDIEIAGFSAKIDQWNTMATREFTGIDPATFHNPVPAERGKASEQIQYVLIAVRENKTYDAILGDFPGGDGDANNCLYCGPETVNLENLAGQFSTLGNYYSNAEASLQGHHMMTSMLTNTYIEEAWQCDRREDYMIIDLEEGLFPTTWNPKGNLFSNCLDHNISLMIHGEMSGCGQPGIIFDTRYKYWNLIDLPFYNMNVKDIDKMNERIRYWTSPGYQFRQLTYMLLPNDHTAGSYPYPTPLSMVADNDEATGLLVDWLTHSPYWKNSVLFITEDDPQDGRDHIDTHRCMMTVVSPWVKRGYQSSVRYSEANYHATIQYLLGLPPKTLYDEIAQPMYDIFTNAPDYTPYTYTPRLVPEEFNPMATLYMQRSKGLNFIDPDEAKGYRDISEEAQKTRLLMKRTDGKELTPSEERWRKNWEEVYRQLWERRQDWPVSK